MLLRDNAYRRDRKCKYIKIFIFFNYIIYTLIIKLGCYAIPLRINYIHEICQIVYALIMSIKIIATLRLK
jgi:hypothetical protein